MKDELDFSMFEEELDKTESDDLDMSMFEGVEEDEQPLSTPSSQIDDTMGAGEAAVTGFGQGASFGLTPIVAGLTGAAGEVAEDAGDYLGLTDDAALRKEGFSVPDDNEGLQGLMDAYYDQRDRQKAQEAKSFEDQPVTHIASNIAGGITSMGATAPLTAGGGALAKILPKAESVKGLDWLQKAGVAAREGAKAGGLAGFGQGDAKLAEGEIGKAALETGGTAVGGAILGGGLSTGATVLGKAGKEIAKSPLGKNIGLGWKSAWKNINISDDAQINDYVRNTSNYVRNAISKNFKGASKKQILEQADEIGIRVSAGESIDDIVREIQETGAFGSKSQKELTQFVQDLKSLDITNDPARQKLIDKVQEQAAKKLNKENLLGKQLSNRESGTELISEVADAPIGIEGNIAYIKDTVKGGWSKPKEIITQASAKEAQVPIKQYDLDSMKLSELDEIITKVGNKAYEGADDSTVPFAKTLYSKLRELSNDAFEGSSLPDKNKKLKALFDGLESLGIKPKDFFSKRETVQDAVEKKIVEKLKAAPLSGSDIDMQNFLKYLHRADSTLAKNIGKESKFASDIAKFITASEGEGSVSLKAAAGPVQKIFAKAGNLAGFGAREVSKTKTAIFDKIKSYTPETVQELTGELSQKFGQKATPYINQLTKAVNSPSQRKNALMYGIYQQPAFKKMLEGIGSFGLNEEKEDYVTKNDDGINDVSTDYIEPKKKEVGKEPSGTNIGRIIEEEEEELFTPNNQMDEIVSKMESEVKENKEFQKQPDGDFFGGINEAENASDSYLNPIDLEDFKKVVSTLEVGGVSHTGAVGKYQFTQGTTNDLNRRYGKRLDRRDPEDQEVLMDLLIEDNKKTLNNKGVPITNTSLYMAHNVGPDLTEILHNNKNKKSIEAIDDEDSLTWASNPAFYFKKEGRGDKLNLKEIEKMLDIIGYEHGAPVEKDFIVAELGRNGFTPMSTEETISKYNRMMIKAAQKVKNKEDLDKIINNATKGNLEGGNSQMDSILAGMRNNRERF